MAAILLWPQCGKKMQVETSCIHDFHGDWHKQNNVIMPYLLAASLLRCIVIYHNVFIIHDH